MIYKSAPVIERLHNFKTLLIEMIGTYKFRILSESHIHQVPAIIGIIFVKKHLKLISINLNKQYITGIAFKIFAIK